jgi:hypothetical protein
VVGLGVFLRRVPLGGVDEHRPLAALRTSVSQLVRGNQHSLASERLQV